jgi:hypothetical protein
MFTYSVKERILLNLQTVKNRIVCGIVHSSYSATASATALPSYTATKTSCTVFEELL